MKTSKASHIIIITSDSSDGFENCWAVNSIFFKDSRVPDELVSGCIITQH